MELPILKSIASTIMSVNTSKNIMALTFDDGPDPDYTPRILDLLLEYKAKATFFVVGQAAEENPAIIQRMIAEGHTIGNHSWDHASFAKISFFKKCQQLWRWRKRLVGVSRKFFRPPYGHQTLLSALAIKLFGYKIVGADVISEDWRFCPSEDLVDRVLRQAKAGSVIILHDRIYLPSAEAEPDRANTLVTLRVILSELSPRFDFVTIETLLKNGKPVTENWIYDGR